MRSAQLEQRARAEMLHQQNLALAKRLARQQLARATGLLSLPVEVLQMIFSYAVDGGGKSIICTEYKGRVRYYRDGCVDIRLRENDPSQSPGERAKEEEFDIMVTDATLENENVDLVLPRLKYEHTSTAGTLCTFTYDEWRTLRVEVNTWELSDGRAIGGLLQDLGEDGQLSMRDLHIYVTNRSEAHDLQQVSLFRNLHTLVI